MSETRIRCANNNIYKEVKEFFNGMVELCEDLVFFHSDNKRDIICNYDEKSVMVTKLCLGSMYTEPDIVVMSNLKK